MRSTRHQNSKQVTSHHVPSVPRKKRILLGSLILLLAALVAVCFSPFIVANSLRLWISWKARQEKLTVTIDKINAPFLGPVQMRGLRVATMSDSAFRIEVVAAQAILELNLRAILLPKRGRAIRTLSVEGIRAEMHRNYGGTVISHAGWNSLQHLLPSNFNFNSLDLRVEDGATVVLLRNASLSASQVEAGRFRAVEIMIVSPWLRQNFLDLRGATHWEGDRLTIAGVTLTHGFDLEWVVADLSHLGQEYLGLQFDAAVFGGKIRADISNEWHSQRPNWNVVGSASDISLAQTSEAIGFADRANGLLHACKFTFHGDPRDVTSATASIWAELTELKWRERAAETIMLGAALYNRQIQLQQLYLKQRENELTLSGEGAFVTNQSGWLNPVFRGDISALISNLGEFAGLFGARPDDFAGEVAIEGTMNARDRKIGGHLTASGKNLSIFRSPIDSFATKLNLTATELEIEQLELHHKNDFARATGKIDVAHEHEYSGTAQFSAANVADYVRLFSSPWSSVFRQGMVRGDWSGSGKATSHTGKFHINGNDIVMAAPAELLPFDAEVDAAYSPTNIFFRQLHLANEHASLNGFLTIAQKYLQLQALALDLNGKPQLRGNVFVPIALSKLDRGRSVFEALDPDQKLDFDMNVEPTDLAELSRALTDDVELTGILSGRFSIFGGLNALQGWGEAHLRDFATEKDPARVSADLQTRLTSGTMVTQANVQFRECDPIACEVTAPIRFGRANNNASTEPMTANFSFPKISLEQLPRYLTRDLFREGTLSGKLAASETLRHPKIFGDLQLLKARPGPTSIQVSAGSARLTFGGTTASIVSANLETDHVDVAFRGEIDFADTNAISITVLPTQPITDLRASEGADCISGIKIVPRSFNQPALPLANEIVFAGGLGGNWTVMLNETRSGGSLASLGPINSNRTLSICFGANSPDRTLALGCELTQPQIRTEKIPPRKKPKRR